MIKSIEIENHLGEWLTIYLGAPERSRGLWIKSLKGIGPGKADINTTDIALSDGGVYNSSRAQIRNITLTIGIIDTTWEEDGKRHSVEEARRALYKAFPRKKQIRFVVNTDLVNLYTYGYVESNEPDIFNKQETTAISIICPDPNWYDVSGYDGIDFSATDNVFEFPYSFGVSTDDPFEEGKIYYERTGEDPDYHYYVTYDTERQVDKTYYEEIFPEGIYTDTDPLVESEFIETEDTSFIPGKEYFEIGDPYEYQVSSDDPFEEGKIYYERSGETEPYIYTPTTDTERQSGKTYYEGTRFYIVATSDSVMSETKTYYEYGNNLIFANILDIPEKNFNYDGEIETGVVIEINIHDEASGLVLYKLYGEGDYDQISIDDSAIAQVTEGAGLIAGDYIRICTTSGKKSAILIRNAISYNIINALGKNPNWFVLDHGLNTFTYDAAEGKEYVMVTISYLSGYEGI